MSSKRSAVELSTVLSPLRLPVSSPPRGHNCSEDQGLARCFRESVDHVVRGDSHPFGGEVDPYDASEDSVEQADSTVAIELVGRKHRGTLLIDRADLPLIEGRPWHCLVVRSRNSAVTYAATSDKNILLHRVLLGASKGQDVDHINRNGLDNRRCNIRLASRSLNNANQIKRPGCGNRFKGVSYRRGCWRALICVNGKRIELGTFPTDVVAAHAYDAAARQHFGEFARLNFPRPGERSALSSPTSCASSPACEATP